MTLRLAVMWIVLATVLGFALGGTFVDWSLERPPYQKQHSASDSQQPQNSINNDRSAFFAIGAWAADNAAAIGALSAIGVLLFTIVLAYSTVRLWEATRGLQKSGEQQFLATHRPRVVVRFVQGPAMTENGGLATWITFANSGPNNAKIVSMGHDLGLRRDGRWIATGIDAELKAVTPFTLGSGDRHTIEVPARQDDIMDRDITTLWRSSRQAIVRDRHVRLCLVGEVRYRDDNGTIRHTGYWRVFDPESDRWIPDNESGGEYED